MAGLADEEVTKKVVSLYTPEWLHASFSIVEILEIVKIVGIFGILLRV